MGRVEVIAYRKRTWERATAHLDAAQLGIFTRLCYLLWDAEGHMLRDSDKRLAAALGVEPHEWRSTRSALTAEPDPLLVSEDGYLCCPMLSEALLEAASGRRGRQ